jgi:hypothetical protein
MSEIQNEAHAKALQEIEKLRLENSKLREEWLELTDVQLSYTGLPGHLHRLDVKMKELKSLLIRAADALEKRLIRDALTVSSGTAKRRHSKPPPLRSNSCRIGQT